MILPLSFFVYIILYLNYSSIQSRIYERVAFSSFGAFLRLFPIQLLRKVDASFAPRLLKAHQLILLD
jgi:hypothetical protein